MAFPIVKMGNKNPKTSPSPCTTWNLHLIQQCIAPKSTPSVDRSPNLTTCLIPGPVRPMMPNGIRICSAVFPQCTGRTDAPTHRPTDRPRESLITIGRCSPRATWPNNICAFQRMYSNCIDSTSARKSVTKHRFRDSDFLYGVKVLAVRCCFRLCWRFFTVHPQFRP